MTTKIRVSRRAAIARINRVLAKRDEVLRASRGARCRADLGDHYILDWRINGVVEKDVNVEDVARELGVLHPYEVVADRDDELAVSA
jgi:hypothetical protein